MNTEQRKAALMDVYTDPANVGSFRGVKRLYNEARKTIKNLTHADVKDFLQGVDSYTLHAPMNKRMNRENYLVNGPGVILGGDTCILDKLADANDGFKYIGVFADLYSRYMFAYPLKSMTGKETASKVQHLLSNSKRKFRTLFTDKGTEFWNGSMTKVLAEHNMKQYSVHSSDIKNGLLEILIRRLKTRIFRYLTHKNTERYIDVLPSLVASFNNSKMVALFNRTPKSVYEMTDRSKIRRLTLRMYKRFNDRKIYRRTTLKVGAYVRISRLSKTQFVFNKDYLPQTSEEVFQVYRVNSKSVPVTYYLKDLMQEPLLGKFYLEELQPVHLPGKYRIKILKTVGKGKHRKHLVAWLGYPPAFNSYIKDRDLINEKI